ncbi:polypeptide N-acetylgalactosaminyltransferase 13 [Octopus bimaculoides]|uniref:Polypeptide N-acetylgalactosaminyltransferase n=1 Tax=Octopus bimaculoides TaxID=37653 RepID=A0A0L8HF37_OCTBM|nr:polypeptide N-acetylgalactosaminyltransferase 13 [Octopus bimaculoides]|eukprot:XP_014772773.1 PREDICTED: polypeptide N-acetylgalactosaminyltransferase 13-like [Octopus bimaculoides]
MTLKYRAVFRMIFTYRVVLIVFVLWLISNIIFFHKLLPMANYQHKEIPMGLTRNESERLEKLSEKLRRLEKINFNGKHYDEYKNYSQGHRNGENNFLIIKDEKNENKILPDNKGRITAPNPLQINNNYNKAKENILIHKGEIQKYDMDLLQDVAEENYPGKGGAKVIIDVNELTASEKEQFDLGWQRNQFNQYVSDMIPLNRDIAEVREPGCDRVTYPSNLPSTTVIICFHNEAWSTLLRTVHSVLRHTSLELLSSIILVDDASTFQFLKRPLEDYIKQLPKVRIIRSTTRLGLIRARLFGVNASRSEIITFLDSHCECVADWLRPMLARLVEKPNSVVSPVIDTIDSNTFEYFTALGDDINVGIFDWSLAFKWMLLPERIKKIRISNLDPVMTPTIAGGLLSMRKDFFERLGTFDPGFETWGSENLELSFKTWMCGGRMDIMPCSHVGHIFRASSPYKWPKGVAVVKKNAIRLAEVWMDNYKNIYYNRINWNLVNYGDVSQRKTLRENLKCKTFKWYLKNIVPEMLWIKEVINDGLVMNLDSRNCLVAANGMRVEVTKCDKASAIQHIYYTTKNELRINDNCLDFKKDLRAISCHDMKGNQVWTLLSNRMIYHNVSNLCLENVESDVTLMPCSYKPQQMWSVLENRHAENED